MKALQELFGVTESYRLPDKILEALLSDDAEKIVKEVKANIDSDIRDMFQDEQGDREKLPVASDVDDIKDSGTVVIVQFDLESYNKKHNNRAVKKTLTIPEWLNERALAMNVNFSQVLQDALMEKVGIR